MRTVWIAVPVGVRVVLAMVCDPGDDRTLYGHRPQDGKQVFQRFRGLKGTVGE